RTVAPERHTPCRPDALPISKAGGIGVIAGSGLEPDELAEEIRSARKIAGDGVIGVNIMVAVSALKELVHVALREGLDLVIAGARTEEHTAELHSRENIVCPI